MSNVVVVQHATTSAPTEVEIDRDDQQLAERGQLPALIRETEYSRTRLKLSARDEIERICHEQRQDSRAGIIRSERQGAEKMTNVTDNSDPCRRDAGGMGFPFRFRRSCFD